MMIDEDKTKILIVMMLCKGGRSAASAGRPTQPNPCQCVIGRPWPPTLSKFSPTLSNQPIQTFKDHVLLLSVIWHIWYIFLGGRSRLAAIFQNMFCSINRSNVLFGRCHQMFSMVREFFIKAFSRFERHELYPDGAVETWTMALVGLMYSSTPRRCYATQCTSKPQPLRHVGKQFTSYGSCSFDHHWSAPTSDPCRTLKPWTAHYVVHAMCTSWPPQLKKDQNTNLCI